MEMMNIGPTSRTRTVPAWSCNWSSVTNVSRIRRRRRLREVQKLKPTDPEVYLEQAAASLKEGRSAYDKARRILQEGLAKVPAGCKLKLISSLKDTSGIPDEGENLIIVAAMPKGLHVRIFNGDRKQVTDADDKKLTTNTEQIADLKRRLEGLWPPHEVTTESKTS